MLAESFNKQYVDSFKKLRTEVLRRGKVPKTLVEVFFDNLGEALKFRKVIKSNSSKKVHFVNLVHFSLYVGGLPNEQIGYLVEELQKRTNVSLTLKGDVLEITHGSSCEVGVGYKYDEMFFERFISQSFSWNYTMSVIESCFRDKSFYNSVRDVFGNGKLGVSVLSKESFDFHKVFTSFIEKTNNTSCIVTGSSEETYDDGLHRFHYISLIYREGVQT